MDSLIFMIMVAFNYFNKLICKKISFCRTCNEFAEILGAEILSQENNVCTVTFMRDINVKILGRRTQSPLALAALFSFEAPDNKGRTLNLGETVILQNEINDFISALRERGILVTATP